MIFFVVTFPFPFPRWQPRGRWQVLFPHHFPQLGHKLAVFPLHRQLYQRIHPSQQGHPVRPMAVTDAEDAGMGGGQPLLHLADQLLV